MIGLNARRVRVEGTHLLVELELSKPLGRAVEASIYVAGYRADAPFEALPKIQVRLDETRSAAYDQDTELSKDSVDIVRRARRITVRIAMKVIVKRGDLLAQIDPKDCQLRADEARAAVAQAQAQLDLLTAGSRGEDVGSPPPSSRSSIT